MSCIRTLFVGTMLALCAATAIAQDNSPTGFADRAPANACLALHAADVGSACEAFRKTRMGEKFCGPEFAPLIAELAKRDIASALHMRPAFGFDWSDLAAVHDAGGLLVYPLPDGELGSAWLFVPGKPIDKTPECLLAAGRYFQQKGFRDSNVRRPNANLTVLQPPANSAKDRAPVLFASAQFYGIANSQAAADALLAVRPDKSLARQSSFVQLTAATAGDDKPKPGDVTIYTRPFELWELLDRARQEAKKNEPKTPAPPSTEKEGESDIAAARRLGLGAVQAACVRVDFQAAAPCEWSARASFSAKRPYDGAMRILELRPGQLPELPDWARPDAVTAGAWRWDFPLAMKGFGNVFDQTNEPGPDGAGLFEDLLDGLRDDPEGVQIDLRRDLFEHLGPQMLGVSDDKGKKVDRSGDTRRWIYVASVRNMAQAAETLTKYYRDDERVHHEQKGEYEVWTVGEGASLFVEGESDSLVTVRGLALGQDRLLIATDIDFLNAAISPSDDAPKLLADGDWSRLWDWTKAQKTETTALASLVRIDDVLEPSYHKATAEPTEKESAAEPRDKRDTLGGRMWRRLLFGASEASKQVPRSLAPKFEQIRSAFPRGGSVMSEAKDGWDIRFGALGATTPPSP